MGHPDDGVLSLSPAEDCVETTLTVPGGFTPLEVCVEPRGWPNNLSASRLREMARSLVLEVRVDDDLGPCLVGPFGWSGTGHGCGWRLPPRSSWRTVRIQIRRFSRPGYTESWVANDETWELYAFLRGVQVVQESFDFERKGE